MEMNGTSTRYLVFDQACLLEKGGLATLRDNSDHCLTESALRGSWGQGLHGPALVYSLVRYIKERGDFEETVDAVWDDLEEVLGRYCVFLSLRDDEREALTGELGLMAEQCEFREARRLTGDSLEPALVDVQIRNLSLDGEERFRKTFLAGLRRKHEATAAACRARAAPLPS